MAETKKIEFTNLVNIVLDTLVCSCPLPLTLTVETFNLPKGSYEVNLHPTPYIGGHYNQTPEEKYLESTLEWLLAEGFIRKLDTNEYVATLKTLQLYEWSPKLCTTS